MTIKKDDFVELDFTGSVKADGFIFDTTDKDVAKQNKLPIDRDYSPIITVVGGGYVLKGIDNSLIGKQPGEYELDIAAEDAFGKKNPKLIQLISTSKFSKQNIKPQPGLQVQVDNMVGIIKTVTGGRTIVDFNHPLSGKELHYKINVKRVVQDLKEQIAALFTLQIGGMVPGNPLKEKIEEKEGVVTITTQVAIPDKLQEQFTKNAKELTKAKDIKFVGPSDKTQE